MCSAGRGFAGVLPIWQAAETGVAVLNVALLFMG
jgi:hypothetical protein